MDRRAALAAVPYVFLPLVFRYVPLPPAAAAPLPWLHAGSHAVLLLGLMAAHTWCYARWQPHAPRRMLTNELLARLWFAAYGVLVVQRVSGNGWAFPLLAVPWALLCWEVHRQDVGKRGYDAAWNLANWGLFLLGLALMEMAAVQL